MVVTVYNNTLYYFYQNKAQVTIYTFLFYVHQYNNRKADGDIETRS